MNTITRECESFVHLVVDKNNFSIGHRSKTRKVFGATRLLLCLGLGLSLFLFSTMAFAQKSTQENEANTPPERLAPVDGEVHELDDEHLEPFEKKGLSKKAAKKAPKRKVKHRPAAKRRKDLSTPEERMQAACYAGGIACALSPIVTTIGFCGGTCIGCGLAASYFSTLWFVLPTFLGGLGTAIAAFFASSAGALLGGTFMQERLQDTWASFFLGGAASALFGLGLGTLAAGFYSQSESFTRNPYASMQEVFLALVVAGIPLSIVVGITTGVVVYFLPLQRLLAENTFIGNNASPPLSAKQKHLPSQLLKKTLSTAMAY
ncbi:MAG: hypothetical protein GY822_32215 [Deltaproteobacteria bacterium]|nr:hypothetical protein [Deltaproteobacteria bacterium]